MMRPANCLMASAAAMIGMLIAGHSLSPAAALPIFVVVFLVTGAGNAVNDYFDRDIDKINRPDRPIPRGAVSPKAALVWSLVLFAAGCAISGLVNQICLAIAIFNSLLLYLYARNLKATPLAGNLAVSYLTGSSFVFGGAAFGMRGLEATISIALLAALATMSREIAKDIEDMEGDRKCGAKTLPIIAGEKASGILAALLGAAAVALSFFVPLGVAYLAIVAMADLFFLLSIAKLLKKDFTGAQKALKMGMAVALLAFLAGALQPLI